MSKSDFELLADKKWSQQVVVISSEQHTNKASECYYKTNEKDELYGVDMLLKDSKSWEVEFYGEIACLNKIYLGKYPENLAGLVATQDRVDDFLRQIDDLKVFL